MLHRKITRLFPAGVLMLSVGLLLHNFIGGRYTEFAAGFLIGMAAVFIIAGSVGRLRGSAS